MAEIGVVLFLVGGVCLPVGIIAWIIRAIMKRSTVKNLRFICGSMAMLIIGFVLIVAAPTEKLALNDTTDELVTFNAEQIQSVDANSEYLQEETEENLYEKIDSFSDEEENIMPTEETNLVDTDDIYKNYEKYIYPISEFPYENKKMSKKVMKLYDEVMKAKIEDFICLEEISKGGIITEKLVHYKKTINENDAQYRYYGKLNKKSEPDGIGIIIENWSSNFVAGEDGYCLKICYVGEFKNGYKEGYGIVFHNEEKNVVTVEYEGEFKKGKYEGEGTLFSYVFENDCSEVIREWALCQMRGEPNQKYDYLFEGFGESNVYTYPIVVATKEYTGEFKAGKYHGEGKEYFGADENNQPYLIYEGEFKEGKYEGKGKKYHYDGGGLRYEGKFENGKYHGKGILYDEQGNVIHKGKFKDGEVY